MVVTNAVTVADRPEPNRLIEPLRDPDLVAALAPYRNKALKVKCITCGGHVGFAWVQQSWPSVVMFSRADRPGVMSRLQYRIDDDIEGGRLYIEGGTMRITCRPRCNRGKPRRYVFDARRAAESFVVVVAAGRDELLLGLDL